MITAEKTCFKCNKQKPLSDFYKHKMMADGHLGKCKECTKIYARDRRYGASRENVLEYDRMRAKTTTRKESAKRVIGGWLIKHPERRKAHIAVGNAVRKGVLTPLPCLICGEKAEAHHPDYSLPLDVVWLCSSHHKQAHAQQREAA